MEWPARRTPLPESPPPGLCDAVQGHVCRLAVDAPLNVSATAVAMHVRECGTCSRFVDELARVRQWLRTVPLPTTLAEDLTEAAPMAREALSRELLARFARDLLATAQGKPVRPFVERVRDHGRVVAVTEGLASGPGASPEDLAAVELALAHEPVDADQALEAAAHLDPLGLDIALAWLGSLERAGRGEYAHKLTDQMLARLT